MPTPNIVCATREGLGYSLVLGLAATAGSYGSSLSVALANALQKMVDDLKVTLKTGG
jgi:hypothetical protein